jgi:hypothetical protein
MMRLTDPSVWPAGMFPLRLEPTPSLAPQQTVAVLGAEGASLGELHPLDGVHGELVIDDECDLAVSLDGAWSLRAIGDDGCVLGTHVLCAAPGTSGTSRVTPELAAWTLLTLHGALSARTYGRG